MLHHVSFTAKDPHRAATILAELIEGRVSRFGPQPGGYIAWAPDAAGTAIEIYPHGTELRPGDGNAQAAFEHNYFASRRTATHAAISVKKSPDEVFATALDLGWQASTQDRGGFEVIEFWLENTVMIEILTPAMLESYLSVVRSPQVSAGGSDFETLTMSVQIPTDARTLFAAWTDPAALKAWWDIPSATIDLRIGGAYELLFLPEGVQGNRGSEGCRILSYVPDRTLSFTWNSPSHIQDHSKQTWVVVDLHEVEGGTEIRLTHCGFLAGEDWDRVRSYFRAAWRRVLKRLAAHWDDTASTTSSTTHLPAQSVTLQGATQRLTV